MLGDREIDDHLEQIRVLRVALRYLAAAELPELLRNASVDVYTYDKPEVVIRAHTSYRSAWREAMQAIHAARHALGIGRVTRSTSGTTQTYQGSVEHDDVTITLIVYSSELPPTCKIEYETETITRKVAKIVCA